MCNQKKYLFYCYNILSEFNYFQLIFGCVHTGGVKLPVFRSGAFISE